MNKREFKVYCQKCKFIGTLIENLDDPSTDTIYITKVKCSCGTVCPAHKTKKTTYFISDNSVYIKNIVTKTSVEKKESMGTTVKIVTKESEVELDTI